MINQDSAPAAPMQSPYAIPAQNPAHAYYIAMPLIGIARPGRRGKGSDREIMISGESKAADRFALIAYIAGNVRPDSAIIIQGDYALAQAIAAAMANSF